jgi:signal transduction histidine kinase
MKRYVCLPIFFLLLFATVTAQRIDSLLQVVAQSNKEMEELKASNSLAVEFMRNDIPRAKMYLFNTISLSKSLRSNLYLSSAYAQLVSLYQNSGKMDSATQYFNLLKSLASTSPELNIVSNYYATAGLYYKKNGNLKEAVINIKKGLTLIEKEGNKSKIAGQLVNLGNTYQLMGDFKNALIQHLRALKYFEEENNLKGQSFCYQNISNAFIEMKQYNKALEYAQKSLSIKTGLNDKRGIGTAEIAIGQAYKGLHRYKEALAHYNNALQIATTQNLVPEQTKTYYNIANTYIELKDTARAINLLTKSKEMATQLGDSALVSTVNLALTALQTKKTTAPLSEKTLLQSIYKMQQSGQMTKEANGYQRMAEMFAANQQYDKALEYTKKYYAYSDSISNTELQAQVKKIEEQYNLDKKEKEIAILKKDQLLQQAKIEKQNLFQTGGIVVFALLALITILIINRNRTVQRSRQLLAMEKMRNGIARDLHDDIGSTLTSINILSKVMLQEVGTTDGAARNNLVKIKEHSSSIMDSMSDIVWAINPDNDTVEKVIYKMKEFASEVFEPLNIEYHFAVEGDFSHVKLSLEKRKDLYLIYKEAVNNAAKYSHCDLVKISLKHNEGKIYLNVNDNGKGFDEQTVRPGNGLRNIRARAKNMLASLSFKTSTGAGTDLQLTVPLT